MVNQTYKNIEIILVDDGSPDNSPALCDEWAKKDKRINVIHKENGGVSSARNMALEQSRGQYICFCDSDDYVEPTFIEDLYRAIIDNDVLVSACEISEVDGKHKSLIAEFEKDYVLNVNEKEEFYKVFGYQCIKMITACNKMYKKEVIQNIRFNNNLKCGEDLLFNFDCYKVIDKIACIHKSLYNYFKNPHSVTRSRLREVINHHDVLFPYYKQFAEDIKNPKILQRLSSNYCQNFISNLYLIKKAEGRKKSKQFFKECVKEDKLKYLNEAISCMLEDTLVQKLAKFVMKSKQYGLYLFLGRTIIKQQQKRAKQ